MHQKHTIYTLGTTDTIQTGILEKLKQKQSNCSDINQQPKLEKSPNNLLLQHNISTSALTKTLSQWPICAWKSKFIYKPAKDKQDKVKEQKKEKQTVLYKYFKRRIFGLSVILFLLHRLLYGFCIQTFFLIFQKTVEIYAEHYKTFDLKKIIDWQMEATETLHLSKDTFYTAVAMAKKIYEKQKYQRFSHRVIEIQVASILSLAAKMQSNKINFVEAISAICGFQKNQIIEGEIFIIKALNFKIPSVFIEEKIISICSKWHNFVVQNLSVLKMNQKKVIFGPSSNLQEWSVQGKKNILHFSTLIDLLMLGFYQVIDYENLDKFIHLFLQALFMFVNYQNYELFPSKPSHKTYVVLIFEIFLKQKYQIEGEEFKKWITELIKNDQRLKLVEKTSQYFGLNYHICCNEESQQTTAKFINLPAQDFEYLNQRYKKVILDS